MGVPLERRSAYRRSANSLMHGGVTASPPTGDPILATKTNRYSTISNSPGRSGNSRDSPVLRPRIEESECPGSSASSRW